MVYRNQLDADVARIADLKEELEVTKRTLAEAREELAALRRKYARAQNVLEMIAHSRKVKVALEDSVTGPEKLAEMMASPSNRPPPLSVPPLGETPRRTRRSSAGRYMLVSEEASETEDLDGSRDE